MVDLIKKKRNGHELSKEDLAYIVTGLTNGQIPDYQLSALLMSIYFKGLNATETSILTDAMMRSGDLIDLSNIPGIKVDKHSTGGVGDKTTIVLAPLVAAAGVPVAKMSGRGLGHTGGTLDKLESIKGLSVDMTKQQFIKQVQDHGIAVCGQNERLVPADKKLYALRDVTATVDNISLISSSIMSKKLACGADAIVIDIKVGEGAYMKTEKDAEELAQMLISTGAKMNREVIAVISAMHEPLGYAVGNALEVKEAIDTLKGNGPQDLLDLCLELGSHMLVLAKMAQNFEEGVEKLKNLITSGKAFDKLKEFVRAQGGDVQMIEQTELLPNATFSENYKSNQEGYISHLNALDIGVASVKLGAGRATKTSQIDFGAGILLKKKIGDYVKKGETLAILYADDRDHFSNAKKAMDQAYQFSTEIPKQRALILNAIKNA